MARGEADGGIARLVMETAPAIMRHIRTEMRSRGTRSLSLPQFRALIFLGRHQGCSISQLAEHVGVGLPSASKIVDVLVTGGLVTRVVAAGDRRRVALSLSKLGTATLSEARRWTEARLAERLDNLNEQQRRAVTDGMQALQSVFTPRVASEKGTQWR